MNNNLSLYLNMDPSHKATSTLAVRQAIALAIDRTKVAQIGEEGQLPAENQTGVVLPTFAKILQRGSAQSIRLRQAEPLEGEAAPG